MTKTEMLLAQLDKIDGLLRVQREQCRRLITECHMLMENVAFLTSYDDPSESDRTIHFVGETDEWTSSSTIWRVEPDGQIIGYLRDDPITLASAPKPSPVYTAEAVQQILGDDWQVETYLSFPSVERVDQSARIGIEEVKEILFATTVFNEGCTSLVDLKKSVSALEDACRKLAEHGYKIEGWDDTDVSHSTKGWQK